jgi:hypothetical protein
MSVRRLAEAANVSNPYLSQKALKISVEALYVRAGILPDDDIPEGGVREAIGSDPLLTPEQKQALLNVYESFVAQAHPA